MEARRLLFAQDLKDAEAHLADVMASRVVKAHEASTDARAARVAQTGASWLAERLNPSKYGAKPQTGDAADAGQLLALLKAAIARVALPQLDPAKTIDATPSSRRIGFGSSPPVEGT